MADTLFTIPGKVGDNFFRLPVAYHYAMERGIRVDVAVDPPSRGMVSLLQRQEWTHEIFVGCDIPSYANGGQPWDFGGCFEQEQRETGRWKKIFHLGYRQNPGPDITRSVYEQSGVPLQNPELLRQEACIDVQRFPIDTLAVHMDAVEEGHLHEETHRRNQHLDETLWPVLPELMKQVSYLVFLGLHRYPERYHRYQQLLGSRCIVFRDEGRMHRVVRILGRSIPVMTWSALWALGTCCLLDQVVVMADNLFHPTRFGPRDRVVFNHDSENLLTQCRWILDHQEERRPVSPAMEAVSG